MKMRHVYLTKDKWSINFTFSTEMCVPYYNRYVKYDEYGLLSWNFRCLFFGIRLTKYRGEQRDRLQG